MKKQIASVLGFAGLLLLAQACTPSSGNSPAIANNSGDAALFQTHNVGGHSLALNGTKKLVLTFDDGPFPGVTDGVLDYVKEEGLHVGFFLVGHNIPGNENLLRRMSDEGHTISNHTYDHKPLVKMGRTNMNDVYHQIADTDALIAPFVRWNSNFYFRAPGGTFNPKGMSTATVAMNGHNDLDKYIGPVYWDIGGQISFVTSNGAPSPGNRPTNYMSNAADWECWEKGFPVQACAAAYLRETEMHKGGIVLMHDHDLRTVEMIKILIPEWKKLGYEFITLDQVPGIEKLRSGTF